MINTLAGAKYKVVQLTTKPQYIFSSWMISMTPDIDFFHYYSRSSILLIVIISVSKSIYIFKKNTILLTRSDISLLGQ
jgi:hypothetical protein